MGHRIARLYDEADAMGVTVRECDIAHTDYCGLYDDAHRLVILDQALNDRQRLCVLQHELVHAEYHDRMCGYHSDAKWERRTRRETADRLNGPGAGRRSSRPGGLPGDARRASQHPALPARLERGHACGSLTRPCVIVLEYA